MHLNTLIITIIIGAMVAFADAIEENSDNRVITKGFGKPEYGDGPWKVIVTTTVQKPKTQKPKTKKPKTKKPKIQKSKNYLFPLKRTLNITEPIMTTTGIPNYMANKSTGTFANSPLRYCFLGVLFLFFTIAPLAIYLKSKWRKQDEEEDKEDLIQEKWAAANYDCHQSGVQFLFYSDCDL